MNIEHLKAARKKRGLTQQQVAEAIGVTQSAYKNYECGNREPKGDTIVMLADLFHVSTDYLLGRETGEPDAVERLVSEFDMSLLEHKILDGYLALPPEMRGDLMDFLQKAVREVRAECAEKSQADNQSENLPD